LTKIVCYPCGLPYNLVMCCFYYEKRGARNAR
jgi:hypothetical protein